MAKEICISSTPHETRLAILEDDQLAEIYYERENEYTLAGSIYNGRVTRVLPGMQSAFVDIGLERDAFLYVTDFLELEESEDSDELEKAAASGGNQPPREVRHGDRGQRGGGREQREQRAPEIGLETSEAEHAPLATIHDQEDSAEGAEEPGAKRWRGRRRRRGGRGSNVAAAPAGESEEFLDTTAGESAPSEPEVAHEIHAPAAPRGGRSEQAAEKFVLPGESLSKYGGTPAETTKSAEPAAPPRPASTYKPATLIESPIVWDGSGLLPGESLSRHRGGRAEEPEANVESAAAASSADEIEEQEFVEEVQQDHLTEAEPEHTSSQFASALPDDDVVEETYEAGSTGYEPHAVAGETSTESELGESVEPELGTASEPQVGFASEPGASEHSERESTEFEGDRSASHHVDPLPPAEFRLFGLGGKKKRSDEEPPEGHEPPEQHVDEPRPASIPAVSAFSPGTGLVEEEVIEGEEYDLSRQHHKGEEHDLDDYEEEEKLHTQIRSGELGEMLQEAHLDHRIQLDFDDKNGEEAADDAEEEEEEEPAAAEAQPAGDGHAPQRRERGGRGRRGRGERGDRGGDRGHRSGDRRGPSRRSAQTSDLPIISDLLKPGQEILVQIAKEPIAKKGARITSHIALPGRFLVFMPTVSHVGVSRKIASDEERQRLKRILVHERGDASGGFIVRTAAEGASEEDLRADLRFLIHLWNEIKQRSEASKSPALIYHDLSLIERILRDQVSSNFSSIWVDSEADYERIVRFLNRFSPSLVRRVKLYTKDTPLFEHFGIQDEISKALRSKVWLKSGGSIVINQTEALVAIDINTGKYVGKTARLEDTILKTNLDAIPEIVRQIRLRDLGGIIVIDFIDMDERKNRFKVMAALEEALKSDRAPTKVLQFNDFGLVAITRKRVKQSLERTLSVPCPTCQATGMVKSPSTVANEIYIELRKMKRHLESADVMLRVHPDTVKVLKSNNGSWINEFEDLLSKNILIKSDPTLHPEQFDIQG
ncbi:Rne/Rng family ribonuclease [Occallatibacter savannae]|uniref:Rne/Rng family ribonuclease n=1 Tax=Occallatibacter savannae TaxID=1002691 RepID=UPI000D695F55|nr:Rne/Rng family ribonuclease [Occallatibacter savannae]